MRRLLMMALMALMALQMPVRAQSTWGSKSGETATEDRYRSLVYELPFTDNISKEKLGALFYHLAEKKSMLRAQELVDEYMGDPLRRSIAGIMAKYYKKYLTVSELEEMIKDIEANKETYKSMMAHSNSQTLQAAITQLSFATVSKMLMGKDPEPVELTAPEAYAKLFMEYYETSDMKNIMTKAIEQMMATSGSSVQNDAAATDVLKNYEKYMTENMGNLMCNLLYGTLTEDEIRLNIKLTKKYHLDKVLGDYTMNLQNEGMTIMTDFVEWLENKD